MSAVRQNVPKLTAGLERLLIELRLHSCIDPVQSFGKEQSMPLKRERIIAGKCYIDSDKDRHLVIEINERGIVTYRTHLVDR